MSSKVVVVHWNAWHPSKGRHKWMDRLLQVARECGITLPYGPINWAWQHCSRLSILSLSLSLSLSLCGILISFMWLGGPLAGGGNWHPHPTLSLLHLLFPSLYLVWTQISKGQMLYWGPGNPIPFNNLHIWLRCWWWRCECVADFLCLCIQLDLHDDCSSQTAD